MAKPSYYELLKHPLWQKKRLEIMERAGFTCEWCEAADRTLNIHHGYYEKGKNPWEYPEDTLYCLCEKCHEEVTTKTAVLQYLIGRGAQDLDRLIGYAFAVVTDGERETFPVDNYEMAMGAGDAFHLSAEEVIDDVTSYPHADHEVEDLPGYNPPHGHTSGVQLDTIAGVLAMHKKR